jgi:dTDP-4-amino-4,6-dideoxygalactose transaminase
MQALRRELHAVWDAVIDEAAASGTYTLGSTVHQFEELVEDAWTPPGSPIHAIMVNSGTAALYGALVACGIQPGDAVILPAMTFISTALACSWVGAIPIFVDITPGTWTLSLQAVRALLAEQEPLRRTIKAVIPVHLYGGIMPEMAALLDLVHEEGWKVIEDASQAHGASLSIDGETWRAGTMGDIGCLSMSGVKNAGVAEDGGCLLTRSPEMAGFLRMWRDVGRKPGDRYGFHLPGVRARLGKLAAACGTIQFQHLDEWNARRREIAARYTAAIQEAGLPLNTQLSQKEVPRSIINMS